DRKPEARIAVHGLRQVGKRRGHELPGNGGDAAALLGKLDEARRRNDGPVTAYLARQHLRAEDDARLEIEDRLQVGLELARGDRTVQLVDGIARAEHHARQKYAERRTQQ